MTTMNRELLQALRPEIDAALAVIAKKHGVSMRLGSGSFSSETGSATFKLNVACLVASASGAAPAEDPMVIKARNDWVLYCKVYGLNPNHIGMRITFKSKAYYIEGLMPNRPKYPILVRPITGGKPLLLQLETYKREMEASRIVPVKG